MNYIDKKNKNYEDFLETLELIKTNEDINKSLKNSNVIIYDETITKKEIKYNTEISVIDEDVIKTILKNKDNNLGVLVFSSKNITNYTCMNNSQEERIFRSSTLYKLIDTSECLSLFYSKNKKNNYIYTNSCIFVKNALVFKDEYLINKDLWAYPNFILSCPPDMNKLDISKEEHIKILYKKLINVFNVAIENNIEVLILGAYGCGESYNSPIIVSNVFKKLLEEYNGCFKKIIFSVKMTKYSDSNYKTFKKILLS